MYGPETAPSVCVHGQDDQAPTSRKDGGHHGIRHVCTNRTTSRTRGGFAIAVGAGDKEQVHAHKQHDA